MKVFSFWTGPISWIERLSIASSLSVGHELTIFSYEPNELRRQGLGTRIEDAREVLFDPRLGPLQANKPDHFSDHFRVEGIAKGFGVWTDLDIVFIKALPDEPYIFGWFEDFINGAILYFPEDSAMLADYLALCRKRPVSYVAPWWPWHQKAARYLKLFGKKIRGRPILPMHYGPPAVTHLVHKHNLTAHAAAADVYYPTPGPRAGRYYVEAGGLEPFLTPRTRAVHLWRSVFVRHYGQAPPPADSWLGKKCQEFGVDNA